MAVIAFSHFMFCRGAQQAGSLGCWRNEAEKRPPTYHLKIPTNLAVARSLAGDGTAFWPRDQIQRIVHPLSIRQTVAHADEALGKTMFFSFSKLP